MAQKSRSLTKEDLKKLSRNINGKFAGVDQHLTGIDEKFTNVDKQFANVDKQFTNVDKKITSVAEGLRESIKENTREIIAHFNESQASQDEWIRAEFRKVEERFAQVDVKLEAIIEMLATKQELMNLVFELKAKGIDLDAAKVFIHKHPA